MKLISPTISIQEAARFGTCTVAAAALLGLGFTVGWTGHIASINSLAVAETHRPITQDAAIPDPELDQLIGNGITKGVWYPGLPIENNDARSF